MEQIINVYKGKDCQEYKLDALRAELSQYLKCERLNFLFGSGCSSYLKNETEIAIPTMGGLFDNFFEQNPDFKVGGIDPRDQCNRNLELLMDYLVSIKMVSNLLPNVDDQIDKKIETVQSFIKEAITEGQKCDEVFNLYRNFYTKLVQASSKNPINIFTTNYDLFHEKALDDLGFFYNNGFSGTYKRTFNPNSYNYVFVENMNLNKDVWGELSNFYNLFKIHGSINWAVEDDLIVEKSVELCTKDRVMIYPTPQKDRSTLMTPYSDLMRNMQQLLSRNNSVLITLGYSFSDDHINRIILNSLSNPSFKLVVFGESDGINNLIKLNDKRIIVINSADKIHYFDSFVENVMPDLDKDLIMEFKLKDGLTAIKEFITADGENNE